MRILLLLLVCSLKVYAQTQTIRGIVVSDTNQPIPFATVAVAGTHIGTHTNDTGLFTLTVSDTVKTLTFTCIGYQTHTQQVQPYMQVRLSATTHELAEVRITPGENPTHALIRKAIARKPLNDPEQHNLLVYQNYQKITIRPHNSHKSGKKRLSVFLKDTTHQLPLFINEIYSRVQHPRPGERTEWVIGSQTTGTQSTLFSALLPDAQFFSFYPDYLKIQQQNVREFVNPLSNSSTHRYLFDALDTLIDGSDSTFIISFEPQKGKNFEGLKGILHLKSGSYAVVYAEAEPADPSLLLRFFIQQYYTKQGKNWFPTHVHTEWNYPALSELMGQPVQLSIDSYRSQIEYLPPSNRSVLDPLSRRFASDAVRKDSIFWQQHRLVPLTTAESQTYARYDQLPFFRKTALRLGTRLAEYKLSGVIPAGYVQFPLVYLLGGNIYEGPRLGWGVQTSSRFSKKIQLQTTAAYGLRDQAWKWGVAARYQSDSTGRFQVRALYRHDVWEPANAEFLRDKQPAIVYESLRNLLVSRADSLQQLKVEVALKALLYGQFFGTFLHEKRTTTYGYSFAKPMTDMLCYTNQFRVTEMGIGLKYVAGEQYQQVGAGEVLSNPARHTWMIHLGRGLQELNGEFAYTRLTTLYETRLRNRTLGQTYLHLAAGKIWGNLPYPYLVSMRGSQSDANILWVANHFQTMSPYEFVADQYAYGFLTHTFGSLLVRAKSGWFQPDISVIQGIAIGTLSNANAHQGILIQSPSKGFFESGVSIDNLLRIRLLKLTRLGIGGGAFYRWGAYRFSEHTDNWAFRLIWNLSF